MERTIKAIPTEYNGTQYRSRTEARWAIFFDLLGVNVKYESAKVQTGISNYIPDFILPDQRMIFEVKGSEPTPLEKERISDLALSGVDYLDAYRVISSGPPGSQLQTVTRYSDHHVSCYPHYFSQCAFCGELGLFMEGDLYDWELRPQHHDLCHESLEVSREFDVDDDFYNGFGNGLGKPLRHSVVSPMVEIAVNTANSISFDSRNFYEIIALHKSQLEVLRSHRVFCGTLFLHHFYRYLLRSRKNESCPRFHGFDQDPAEGEEDKRFLIYSYTEVKRRLTEEKQDSRVTQE